MTHPTDPAAAMREAAAKVASGIMEDKEILSPEQARGAALVHAAIRAIPIPAAKPDGASVVAGEKSTSAKLEILRQSIAARGGM